MNRLDMGQLITQQDEGSRQAVRGLLGCRIRKQHGCSPAPVGNGPFPVSLADPVQVGHRCLRGHIVLAQCLLTARARDREPTE